MIAYKERISQASIYHFRLLNVSCVSCIRSIERALKTLGSIQNFQINFPDRLLTVKADVLPQEIIRAIEKTGYRAELLEETSNFSVLPLVEPSVFPLLLKTILAAVWGLILMGVDIIKTHWHFSLLFKWEMGLVWGILTLLVMLYSGGYIYRRAFKQLLHGHMTMDTLITMGTLVAWIYSLFIVIFPDAVPMLARHVYFETSIIILAFINLGALLEMRARHRTGDAIRKLMNLQPKTARVIRDDQVLDIPIGNIMLGDVIQIRPGEVIPVDGEIIEGETYIDESMLTGEPMPVLKKFGHTVIGGTLNKLGSFLFRAEKLGKDTVLAQIIQLVKYAQQSKLPIAQFVDRVSSLFVPAVILIAILTACLWYFAGPIHIKIEFMLVTSIAVLVIACPCALGLATPISIVIGMGRSAQRGILIRNGEALQRASQLTTIVLDKTGTITKGQPEVTLLHALKNFTEEKLLQWSASIELHSEHPIATAITTAAKKKEINLLPVNQFQAIVGQGVKGLIEEHEVLLGNQQLMKTYHVNTDTFFILSEELATQAQTSIFLAIDRIVVGLIAVSDPVKADSKIAIARLKKQKLKIVLLTGDNEMTAERIADQVGIEKVIANVSPKDKFKHIEKLQEQGECVGMVGDGINDAPSLAQANVGFAIGAGTDVAISASDVTLMRNSIDQVADAIAISKKIMRNIKQNLFFSFLYNVMAIPVAAGALYPFFKLLLNPMIAAAAMVLSSITVVINASRLRFLI